ncbi:hypothetical protein [Actinoallomurus iriomotensis]|uniref:Ig-like domain-containing protein n=1 Tax=Actinoallomurus iriomotensis TaxID=478107 RepID=A0A9W6S7V5_9ACTN|nr:hypothetical protein [Actinoallomurus iriomotensis]GLY80919.1 hypothetical protein Airi01_091860 [Actinoallomurus iriomotensis]GLY88698.1 hypothetical protein Airi02_066270 [Actinoallomurus iriomotensis]
MRKLLSSSLFVGGAAAAALALSSPAAFAAGWTVTNGNASGAFTVGLKSGTTVTFKDVNTNQTFTCSASTINGSAPAGTGRSNPVASITSGSFTGCTGPLSSTGSATISSGGLNAVTYNSSTDTVSGNISGISAALTIKSILGTCNATVTGSVGNNNQDTYANGTGTLTLTPDPATQTLKIASTSGVCAGLLNANDLVTFQATYVVSSPTPPLTVRPT